jgi:SpoVK/Ycf46/Vps4 family AAA+-type ATPase
MESSGRSDGGTTMRVMASLLTWQAEQLGTLVVATVNDAEALRPEQMRAGRFNKIVWVGLPTARDREKIFAVHLRKTERNPESYDLGSCVELSEGYSGAEIEQSIQNGLSYGFGRNREMTLSDLHDGIRDITPTGKVNEQTIKRQEEWAKNVLGAVDANDTPEQAHKQKAALLDERPLELRQRSTET